jgi:2-octaprenyl-6-methoxyphenol hydroxylase
MPRECDILIVGGGLAGASLAYALADLPLRITVIEAVAPATTDQPQPSFDARAIALAEGSRRILAGLGLWRAMEAYATPIEHIHVSDRGHFGCTRLSARREGVEALGQIVEARHIGAVLMDALREHPRVAILAPARVRRLRSDSETALASLADDHPAIRARLVVGADGGDSIVRRHLAPPNRRWEYGQHALIATVGIDRPHRNTAYERFTDSGPLALLPLAGQRCSLVWTLWDRDLNRLMGLPDRPFLDALQERFGGRLGRLIRVGRRHAYPLAQTFAHRTTGARAVLVGNAAHSIHPIAGQGFNLGLRDVATLAELIGEALQRGEDPGGPALLDAYAARRRADQCRIALGTDLLARLFTNPLAPLVAARNLAMTAIDLAPPLKGLLARSAMGLAGRLPLPPTGADHSPDC